jgi:SAM-dependent methyltransferase
LTLYGFASVSALKEYLSRKHVILDAGCGLGYKAAWFAELAPHALVIGMDYSEAAGEAALKYRALPNLFFAQGDIAATKLKEECVDFVCCDQVIMHTQVPKATFIELARITARDGEIACYFYAKKALPRELLDDHFRSLCTKLDRRELWEMSEQLTELGKRLTELNVEVDVPAIPALGIRGGRADLQRFLYWNFLKCFWNPTLGFETSVITNFDWYSPSNAQRFSEQEVRAIVSEAYMRAVYFHVEEACYAGRFAHASE